jgi:hypothetical protein
VNKKLYLDFLAGITTAELITGGKSTDVVHAVTLTWITSERTRAAAARYIGCHKTYIKTMVDNYLVYTTKVGVPMPVMPVNVPVRVRDTNTGGAINQSIIEVNTYIHTFIHTKTYQTIRFINDQARLAGHVRYHLMKTADNVPLELALRLTDVMIASFAGGDGNTHIAADGSVTIGLYQAKDAMLLLIKDNIWPGRAKWWEGIRTRGKNAGNMEYRLWIRGKDAYIRDWLQRLAPYCLSGIKREGMQFCLTFLQGNANMTTPLARAHLSQILKRDNNICY